MTFQGQDSKQDVLFIVLNMYPLIISIAHFLTQHDQLDLAYITALRRLIALRAKKLRAYQRKDLVHAVNADCEHAPIGIEISVCPCASADLRVTLLR